EQQGKGQGWLTSTGILQEMIGGGFKRSSDEVKDNFVKALHNMMCMTELRDLFVRGGQIFSFFSLINGYSSEVRELASTTIFNLSCNPSFHPALLEVGITSTLVELLVSCPGEVGRRQASAPTGTAVTSTTVA
ncbi:unnamed protein product, partial [Discosporangium mesarthrocarpum]